LLNVRTSRLTGRSEIVRRIHGLVLRQSSFWTCNPFGGNCKGQKVTAVNSASRNIYMFPQNYDIRYCNGMLSGVCVPRLLKNLIMNKAFSSETLMIRRFTSISPYFSYYYRDNQYSANKNFRSRFLNVSMKLLRTAKINKLL